MKSKKIIIFSGIFVLLIVVFYSINKEFTLNSVQKINLNKCLVYSYRGADLIIKYPDKYTKQIKPDYPDLDFPDPGNMLILSFDGNNMLSVFQSHLSEEAFKKVQGYEKYKDIDGYNAYSIAVMNKGFTQIFIPLDDVDTTFSLDISETPKEKDIIDQILNSIKIIKRNTKSSDNYTAKVLECN